ncbi:MAG: carbohydrate porin [Bacteroidetes bacterium]|nr:carbohydrate porin [Bacteroidota bacterium]
MKKGLFILLLLCPALIYSQVNDTVQSKQIYKLEQDVDSLKRTINRMDDELNEIKQSRLEEQSNVDELMAIFGDQDVESSSFNARSRRKRVDALLQAMTQQPGRLLFNGSVTSIMQFTKQKDTLNSFASGSFDIFATTSFGKGTLLFVDMEAIGGDGPDQKYPSFSGLNDDAGSYQSPDGIDRINILEAWGEFNMCKETFTITVGKIDLTNYFDNNASANDETMQFISGSFVNNSSFAVPFNAPGLRLRTTFLKRFHVQFGMSSQENKGADIFDELYKIASLGWTFAPESDFEANIRFYGYQVPQANYSYGWGISFDELLFGKYNIFGRYGQNLDSIASYWPIKSSWSAGFRFYTKLGMAALAIGTAYGENTPYDSNLSIESLFEVYIRYQLNDWVHLSPNFQYVWNTGGSDQNLTVFGLRTHFNF